MDGWQEFTVITGGAAGALVGLLFVAVSIRADLVSDSQAVRSRLAETLTIFLGLLASSILVSLPNPAVWILGTAVLVGLSGVALVLGFEAGLFLLALAAIIGFVGGAIGAWLVLVRPGE